MHTPRLFDAHNHLQEEVLAAHVPAIMARAREAGVARMVCNGTHPGDWQAVADLAHEYPEVVPHFGLHPWFVSDAGLDWPWQLCEFLDRMPSAVGEVGLDRWVKQRHEPSQDIAFRAQLAIARERHLPVTIHCLRAWGWLMDVLRDAGPLPAGMLIHACGAPAEVIAQLTKLGAYFSFAGNVLDVRRLRARRALMAAPLDRLLIETDAPAMLPPPEFRRHCLAGEDGERLNEPANLPAILEGIAALRGMSPDELAELTSANAAKLWGDLLCPTSAS